MLADRGLHKFGARQLLVRESGLLDIPDDHFAAAYDVLVAHLFLEPLVDFRARGLALYYLEPVAGRPVDLLGREDLDDVAVLELVA